MKNYDSESGSKKCQEGIKQNAIFVKSKPLNHGRMRLGGQSDVGPQYPGLGQNPLVVNFILEG